jgi:hypothetical protein
LCIRVSLVDTNPTQNTRIAKLTFEIWGEKLKKKKKLWGKTKKKIGVKFLIFSFFFFEKILGFAPKLETSSTLVTNP